LPLAVPGCAFFLEIIKEKALLAPNVKGKQKIKDKPGALTAVRQVRILLGDLLFHRELARIQLTRHAAVPQDIRKEV
jgi:hypothetical protein